MVCYIHYPYTYVCEADHSGGHTWMCSGHLEE